MMRSTQGETMSAPDNVTDPSRASGRIGRPPGPAKLRLTVEASEEIARRVRIRVQADLEHSSKAIARDYGVTEAAIVGAIRRLRLKGVL